MVPAAREYGLEAEYKYLRPSIKNFPTGGCECVCLSVCLCACVCACVRVNLCVLYVRNWLLTPPYNLASLFESFV